MSPIGLLGRGAANATSAGGLVSSTELIQEAEDHWSVSESSVLIAWLLCSLGSAIIMFVFSWARTRRKLIYMPRIRWCDMALKFRIREGEVDVDRAGRVKDRQGIFIPGTPPVDERLFGWATGTLKLFLGEINPFCTSDRVLKQDTTLLSLIGLDAMTFLEYTRLCRWLFTVLALVCGFPLAAVNYRLNTDSSYGSANSTTSSLAVLTAQNVEGNALYVHIAFEWIATALVILAYVTYSAHHDALVREWAALNVNETAFQTVMVTNMPRRWFAHADSPSAIAGAIAKRLVPATEAEDGDAPATRVYYVDKHHPALAEEVVKTREQLEDCRKAVTITARKAAAGKSVYKDVLHKLTGRPDVHKGQVTPKGVDRIAKLLRVTQDQKALLHKQQHKGPSARWAPSTAAALACIDQHRKRGIHKFGGISVHRAPRMGNILWNNIGMSDQTRRRRKLIGRLVVVAVCIFNTIPVIAIEVLANLKKLFEGVPTLNNLLDNSVVVNALVSALSGVLPTVVSTLFSTLLPIIMRQSGKRAGVLSRGQLDKDVARRLFVFGLVSNFLVFGLLGVLYEVWLTLEQDIGSSAWTDIFANLGDVPAEIAQAYISQSSYWLSYFPVKAAVTTLDLVQINRIVKMLIKGAKVDWVKDLAEMSKPSTFEVSACTPGPSSKDQGADDSMMFGLVVALVFVPLAPLVTVCGCIYFWVITLVYYHQLSYGELTKESDGKMWGVIQNRLLAALILMQLLMCLMVGLKTETYTPVVLAALPILAVPLLKAFVKKEQTLGELIALHVEGGAAARRRPREFEPPFLSLDWIEQHEPHPTDAVAIKHLERKVPELMQRFWDIAHVKDPDGEKGSRRGRGRGKSKSEGRSKNENRR
ncbi:hypothetical protein Q5752_006255 [Cryptotrichosporon argae]